MTVKCLQTFVNIPDKKVIFEKDSVYEIKKELYDTAIVGLIPISLFFLKTYFSEIGGKND
jgi:hypothetical protein